jgi:hypothetical protein
VVFDSNDLGKNRRVIHHWGAAESGLQLGEIETRAIEAAGYRRPKAAC